MLNSIRSRLLATYLLVAGLVLTLVGLSLLFFLLRNPLAERQVYQRLELIAQAVTAREARLLDQATPDRIQLALTRLGLPEGRLLIVTRAGQVLLDSRPQLALPSADVLGGLAEEGGRGDYRVAAWRWLYVSQPLSDGRRIVLAAPGVTLGTLLGIGEEVLGPLIEAAVVALVASLVLAWLMARWVSAPLRRMVDAAKVVAAGDYDRQIPPAGPNEVRSLAEAFNAMVRQVQAGRKAQRDFVANVSHDLRTPLTSIQGFAQAILDGAAAGTEGQQQAARVIYEESDRLRRLVDGLLDLARLDAGQMVFSMALVDLAAIVRGVMERLSLRAAEKQVRLDNQLKEIPLLLADGDRLARVFTNLVDNAIKHTPSGGVVTVRPETEAGWVVVHVEDTGPGIPAEELSRIFERFYQLAKARPYGEGRGVGLGLAISREIVQAHGGRLTAQSTLGQGSRFSVRLPLARAADATPVRRRRSA
ncbi:MAG: HAMP domain-containing sensor histidine kinase [Chloroflexota bacterium]